ncbi:MAG TPA: hypothetical protein VKU82_16060, partial [Planctomycetaceae bacterium]|nr:hypothetical protein [Planctomycetaceae bacterium]
PIFAGSSRQRLLHQIVHEEPRTPRSIDKSVPVELETIILKAISKVPSERYGSAGEFAADLQRFLDYKPILARRPSLADRVKKWSKRHPAVIWSGVIVLLVCICILAVSNHLIHEEQKRTQQALSQEQQRAEEVEQRGKQARQAVDLLIQVCEEELADHNGMQGLRKRLLETALVNYAEFVQQRRADPKAQAELETEQKRVQRILQELKVLEQAHYLSLIAYPEVQTDLVLAKAKREEVANLITDWSRERADLDGKIRALPRDERRSRLAEQYQAQEEALAAVLTPRQEHRLRQILLQVKGPFAFREPEIVSALELTSDQREMIRERTNEAFASVWRSWSGGKREDFHKLLPPAMKDAVNRILIQLTAQQSERWRELAGRPFESTTPILLQPVAQR